MVAGSQEGEQTGTDTCLWVVLSEGYLRQSPSAKPHWSRLPPDSVLQILPHSLSQDDIPGRRLL